MQGFRVQDVGEFALPIAADALPLSWLMSSKSMPLAGAPQECAVAETFTIRTSPGLEILAVARRVGREQTREHPVREVVGLPLGFVAVGGEREGGGHYAGVGDQAAEVGFCGDEGLRGDDDGGEGEVVHY